MNIKRLAFTAASIPVAGLLLAGTALAAAPDGLGPWADSVFATTQGLKKNGQPVDVARSNPLAALGAAENDTVASHFYSLGFGGKVTLGFDNGISSGVFLVEATNNPYPNETAKVEISDDGVNFVEAGTVTQDGTVSVPDEVGCAQYVRITDTSNKALFEATADGFDVDGVKSLGQACPVKEDQCKKDGWKNYGTLFKNQGDCVSFVATDGKNQPAGI